VTHADRPGGNGGNGGNDTNDNGGDNDTVGTETDRSRRAASPRLVEAFVVACGGGAAGALVGSLLHPAVALVIGSIAAINGAICGWCGTYAWRRRDGWLAFVLDSTWAAVPVALGLVAHLGAAVLGNAGFAAELGHRQNRHVYRRGLALKAGFAFTIGNVISGAGNIDSPRRRRLITDHEDVHVWQSRWFGALYPVLYVSWAVGGAIAGSVLWLVRRRDQPIAKVIESVAYYTNPFEWWAYSRDDLWPPPGKLAGVGWRAACARPLATLQRRAARGAQTHPRTCATPDADR
jgi:hypothetical protein